jgi:hypothetical protein
MNKIDLEDIEYKMREEREEERRRRNQKIRRSIEMG